MTYNNTVTHVLMTYNNTVMHALMTYNKTIIHVRMIYNNSVIHVIMIDNNTVIHVFMIYKNVQSKKYTRYIGQNKNDERTCNELKKTKQKNKRLINTNLSKIRGECV
jgi:hypothetical protein